MLQGFLDLLYPVRCPICQQIVLPKEQKICLECKEKLIYVKEPRCKKCSKPIELEENEYCSDCARKNYHFVKGYSLYVYNQVMKQSISDFKYRSKKEYANFYIQEMLRLYGKKIKKRSIDAIVPVPIHKTKYRERGYNQADILAKGIGRVLELPVLSQLLVRNRKTLPQKQLSDKERLRNLQEAFMLQRKELERFEHQLDVVLLVDDIYTTGSTIEACTNILLQSGVREVYFITICIGRGF